jgi:hypothetical protein
VNRIDYNQLKALARQHHTTIDQLIALAPINDPFYTGSPGDLQKARWFADLWNRFGYGQGIHLRRIHYQIVSQSPPINKPDGTPYENTLNDWAYLNNAAKYARYVELVPASRFVDRRNPDAILHARFTRPGDWDYVDPTPGATVSAHDDQWSLYELPDLPTLSPLPYELPDLPSLSATGYYSIEQPSLIELWAEKTTMNDVLQPLAERYHLNLVTGAGELSITAVLALMERTRKAARPAHILYISDYDPAGLGMPISVARKIEYFQRSAGYDDLTITLHPIILTADQVATYHLPRTPVKDSDRRKANWQADHGEGAVELDALEALHPGELERITTQAIHLHYDRTLYDRASATRRKLQFALNQAQNDTAAQHDDELADLARDYERLTNEFDQTRAAYERLTTDFQEQIDAHQADLERLIQRATELYGTLSDELEAAADDIGTDDYPLPDPELPDAPDPLYSSDREYIDQLHHYHAYRHGDNGELPD